MPSLQTSRNFFMGTRACRLASHVLLIVSYSIRFCAASDLANSVGDGGVNLEADVLLVQQRLNEVPNASGGPRLKLIEDGKSGTLTNAAIRRFQKIQLGIEIGRIEAGDLTDARLAEFHRFASQLRPGVEIAWGRQVTSEFKNATIETANSIDVNPDYLMAAMAFESGGSFSPAIMNSAGSGRAIAR